MNNSNIEEAIKTIKKGSTEILPENDLQKKLSLNRPLKIKAGFDPTAPDLHLGHTVILTKLSQLQQLGHKIIFLVGNFTATIGDPTGKSTTRPPLTLEQTIVNAETYIAQAGKIVDIDKASIVFNADWLSKLSALEIMELTRTYTIAQMLEREDFSKRYHSGNPISIQEFIYPLLQGYDSVVLNSDIEIGGIDQKFNLLVGRELQKHYKKAQQCIILMPLLVGLSGVHKMSKSLNNAVGITESPQEIFGKLMSISDELMWQYIDLLSSANPEEIAMWKKDVSEKGRNPKEIKNIFAGEIVARFYSKTIARQVREAFEEQFVAGRVPAGVGEWEVASGVPVPLTQLLRRTGLAESATAGGRLIRQGGVRVNGGRVSDERLSLAPSGEPYLLQVGRRHYARVRVSPPTPSEGSGSPLME